MMVAKVIHYRCKIKFIWEFCQVDAWEYASKRFVYQFEDLLTEVNVFCVSFWIICPLVKSFLVNITALF